MSFPTLGKIGSIVPLMEDVDALTESLAGVINGGLDADNIRRGAKLDTWLEKYSIQHYTGNWFSGDTSCLIASLPTMPSYSGAGGIEYAVRCWALLNNAAVTNYGTLTFSYNTGAGLNTLATLLPSRIRQVPFIGSSLIAHFGWVDCVYSSSTGVPVAFSVAAGAAPNDHAWAGIAVKVLHRD